MTTQRYAEGARYTLDSPARDLLSRIEARSYISDDDWNAHERAGQAVKDTESLWSDYDGMLVPYARQQRHYRAGTEAA